MSRGVSMDAISLDEWELLADHKTSSFMDAECSNGGVGGAKDQLLLGAELVVIDMDHFGPTSRPPPYDHRILDEGAKKPALLPSGDAYGRDPATEFNFKDIGVVPAEQMREEPVMSKVTEIVIYEAEEHGEMIKSSAIVKEIDHDEVLVEAAAPASAPDGQFAREEEGVSKTGFSMVGNLRVNGVGALCSFGVAAATFCIFLLGGKQRPLHKRQRDQKMYAGDDERIQQVVQQASRLNQTVSSVMGGASSARARISFGGYYQGF